MTILDLCTAYCLAVGASQRYAESLKRTARRASLHGLTSVCQLTDVSVNEFLAKLTVSQTTISNMRRELCTMWRWAYQESFVETMPTRVRRVRARYQPPEAWSAAELRDLLDAARRDVTVVSARHNVRACDFMPCWILVWYDTGARFTDILNLNQQSCRNRHISTVAAKTGKVLVRGLQEQTWQELQALFARSPDGTAFRWCLTRRRALLSWRAFLDRHGFRGSSKWLRRSAATALEAVSPNSATKFLQHSNPSLARVHYIDPTLVAPPPMPPAFTTSLYATSIGQRKYPA